MREHKNQGMILFSGWLVASGRASSVRNEFNMVGHTHNIVDQRFSVAGTTLREAHELEAPSQFMSLIQEKIIPRQGRQIHVEEIDAVHAWTSWFASLGIRIGGLTPAMENPEKCHAWRLVRRGDLPGYTIADGARDTWAIEVPQESCALQVSFKVRIT